jgi:hypothetical protein
MKTQFSIRGADGVATYKETIPALYGNYTYEVKKLEAEIGLRVEYVDLEYDVDPNHNTYQSDGYTYFQPFPNARLSYKINDQNKLSVSTTEELTARMKWTFEFFQNMMIQKLSK